MEFDGLFAEAEFGGDDFVGLPGDNVIEDFALAVGETTETFASHLARGPIAPGVDVLFEGLIDEIEQGLLLEGLFEEIDGAILERANGGCHVTMAAEKDDGNLHSPLGEALLQFRTAHAWHAHVEYQAAGARRVVGVEEFGCRGEHLNRQLDRGE